MLQGGLTPSTLMPSDLSQAQNPLRKARADATTSLAGLAFRPNSKMEAVEVEVVARPCDGPICNVLLRTCDLSPAQSHVDGNELVQIRSLNRSRTGNAEASPEETQRSVVKRCETPLRK